MEERNTEKAFHWIIGILQKYKTPFLITGGFAANFYGTTRALADIDVAVPQGTIEKIISEIKGYAYFWAPDSIGIKNWGSSYMGYQFKYGGVQENKNILVEK